MKMKLAAAVLVVLLASSLPSSSAASEEKGPVLDVSFDEPSLSDLSSVFAMSFIQFMAKACESLQGTGSVQASAVESPCGGSVEPCANHLCDPCYRLNCDPCAHVACDPCANNQWCDDPCADNDVCDPCASVPCEVLPPVRECPKDTPVGLVVDGEEHCESANVCPGGGTGCLLVPCLKEDTCVAYVCTIIFHGPCNAEAPCNSAASCEDMACSVSAVDCDPTAPCTSVPTCEALVCQNVPASCEPPPPPRMCGGLTVGLYPNCHTVKNCPSGTTGEMLDNNPWTCVGPVVPPRTCSYGYGFEPNCHHLNGCAQGIGYGLDGSDPLCVDVPCTTLTCLVSPVCHGAPVTDCAPPPPDCLSPPTDAPSQCGPVVCHGAGYRCLLEQPCPDPEWCVRMTLCDGGPLLECVQTCHSGYVRCLTDPEEAQDERPAPNHAQQPYGGGGGSTTQQVAIGFTSLAAMQSSESSEQDPREARCFVYSAYFGIGSVGEGAGDAPKCVGTAPVGPHRVQTYGEIYCIRDSDCMTSGTIHAYLWNGPPEEMYNGPYGGGLSGYYQFYGGGGNCPEASCGSGDWQASYDTIQSAFGLSKYGYDISQYMEGSECRNPYPEAPDPVWYCAGEGGFGAWLW
jgi:hypothetical protein